MALRGYERLKTEDDDAPVLGTTRSSTNRRPVRRFVFLAGTVVLLGALAASSWLSDFTHHSTPSAGEGILDESLKPLEQCTSTDAPRATPPAPINPWRPLTIPESVAVQDYLHSSELDLNLTRRIDEYRPNTNVVFLIEAFMPNKSDALAYLSSPSSAAQPDRYARVTIHHGGRGDPVIKDYLVGPLPVKAGKDGKDKIRELNEIYHRPDIPFNVYGFTDANMLREYFKVLIAPLSDAMEDLFNATARGFPNDTLSATGSGPFSFDGTFRRQWVTWLWNTAGPWLHPLNFYQYIDTSGTDPSLWKILKVVYNHQVFDSTDAFLDAWKEGRLERLPKRPDQDAGKDLDWTTRKRPVPVKQRDLDDRPGPRAVSFGGLRFRVDRETQYISWMGWGMYLSFDRDMGLSLWDIRLRDERIIYQLAPQEAVAQYAGNDPHQSTTAWLDRYFGMGSDVRDLIPHYDCPAEAVYLPAVSYTTMGYVSRRRAICVFEQDSGKPLTRHTGYEEGEFGAVKGYQLVVRSIATVGNYDYLFDYTFQLDGTIEVRISASGYLQGGFWEVKQEGYGGKIRDTTMGNLHDHVINFKVDLDIAGTHNTLRSHLTSQEEVEQPWFDDDWGSTVIQQKIHTKYIENEDDALLKWAENFQGVYAVVNKNELNEWGVPRGYAVLPGSSPIRNTVVGSKRLLNNANWARYNMAVSKRKDTEPSSSSMWNMNLPGDPTVDFHKFFDGEDIAQEDLVVWVNVGMHHLPQSEDSPNTKTNIATSSFTLTPLNYFSSDISLDSSNAILLSAPNDTTPYASDPVFGFDNYGVSQHSMCVPRTPKPFRYEMHETYDLDGKKKVGMSLEELRENAEMIHRVKLG